MLTLAVPVSEMVTFETQGPVTVPDSEQFVVQLAVTVKADPLLAVPNTVTTTLPVLAPVGTDTVMLVGLQALAAATPARSASASGNEQKLHLY